MRQMTLKTLMLGFLLITATVTFGQQSWEVDAIPQEKKVAVKLKGNASNVIVRIIDADQNTLVNQTLKGTKTSGQIFNLEKLQPGEYTILVADTREEVEQSLKVTKKDVVLANDAKAYFVPNIRFQNQKLDVSYLNQNLDDVTIRIEDTRGEVVYEDAVEEELLLEKRYDLKGLRNGNYQLIVETPRKSYYKSLAINN